MTEREALKLALEALKHMCHYTSAQTGYKGQIVADALSAIDKALAQTEQEPVAWASKSIIDWLKTSGENSYAITNIMKNTQDESYAPLYTTPPQRTWVGLTDDEQQEAYEQWQNDGWGVFYNAIEAKLKEKNT